MSRIARLYWLLITLATITIATLGIQPTLASAGGGLELLSPHLTTGAPLKSYRPTISADGRFVAFHSDACCHTAEADSNGTNDVFVRDRQTQTTILVSKNSVGTAAGSSLESVISGDSNYVAFASRSSSFVPGDTNAVFDIFVWERATSAIERVSIATNGTQGNADSRNPTISADGRFVVFESFASTLVTGDTNDEKDLFVRDRLLGTTTLVSVAHDGGLGNEWSKDAEITADGRHVVFNSLSTNMISTTIPFASHIYLRDLQTGTTELISVNTQGEPGDDSSYQPTISAFDGRFIAFQSDATNLDPRGYDDQIFLRDRELGTTVLVSASEAGVPATSDSEYPVLNGDGQFVFFFSWAPNLVENDTSDLGADYFVRDNATGKIMIPSINDAGQQTGAWTSRTDISWDGRFVVFDGGQGIYLREVQWPVPTAVAVGALTTMPRSIASWALPGSVLLVAGWLLHRRYSLTPSHPHH